MYAYGALRDTVMARVLICLAYDPAYLAGQAIARTDPLDGQQHAYGYDPLNRLTSDGRAAATTAWAYNAAQDLTAITDTACGTTSALAYDNADQLTALRTTAGITQTGNLSVAYDGNGNRTSQQDSVSGASARYGYDQADRLLTATVGTTTTASYGYDGDGLRQSKTVNGAPTAQTWDTAGAGGLPQLLQDGCAGYRHHPWLPFNWMTTVASTGAMARRIAVIDDDGAIRDLLAEVLADEGYEPLVFADSEATLPALGDHPRTR